MAGCDGRRERREIMNMPDMHYSPAVKAQEPDKLSPTGSSMRPPVPGTVPVNFQPYTITNDEADTVAAKLANPLPATREVLKAGEKYYNIFCLVCHGKLGLGDGAVIKANAGMPQPPSLMADKVVKEWSDGRIFHVITVGQGNMPSYAARMDAEKRWAVIHYLRAMQRAQHPTEADLKAAPKPGAKPPKPATNSTSGH